MINGWTTFVIIALGLWVLIAVHEVGHVVAARRVGIPVIHFRVGGGPSFGWWVGGTRVELAPFPTSGFVVGDPRCGEIRSWRRVIAAGPITSLAFAVALSVGAVLAVGQPAVLVGLAVLAVVSLLMACVPGELRLAGPEGKQRVPSDLRQLRLLRCMERALSPMALSSMFGDKRVAAEVIDSVRTELSNLDPRNARSLTIGRVRFRLGDDFGPEVGSALLRLAATLPDEVADGLRNTVIFEAATRCWEHRDGAMVALAHDLVVRNPGVVAYSDTYGSLLTSIGRGQEGLPLLMEAGPAVARFERLGPMTNELVGHWHMFVAVALHASGAPASEVHRHLDPAVASGVTSPLLDELRGQALIDPAPE